MEARIHVVGLGAVSAIGESVAETFNSLKSSRSGIGPLSSLDSIYQNELPVGEVKLSDTDLCKKLGIKKNVSRTTLLGLAAAREALQHAHLERTNHLTCGLISATTVGGMDRTEKFMIDFLNDHSTGNLRDIVMHECGSSSEWIAQQLQFTDFISTINTACSSSVNSIILAARMIAAGKLDVAMAGGTDALTRFTLNGFNSLMILDKFPCRPFDAGRQGLNLGEGAGYVVLVSEKVLGQQKLNSLATVSGFANTNDAFHQTASSPEGIGSFLAMQQALAHAKLLPEQINYINLHGTGTQNNDSSEGKAIQRLFGQTVPPVSSTKAYTGHTLGASGGIEAVFSVLALLEGCVFPNLRFTTQMPELDYLPQQVFADGLKIQHVLSNSFGFGGNCSSIIFSKS